MSASETPRTDALHCGLTKRSEMPGWIVGTAYIEMNDHARQLERELAAAKAESDKYRMLWERDSRGLGTMIGEYNTARAVAEDRRSQALTAEAERDALRAELAAAKARIDELEERNSALADPSLFDQFVNQKRLREQAEAERDALRAELAAAKAALELADANFIEAHKAYDRANFAYKEDAERYRWLRDECVPGVHAIYLATDNSRQSMTSDAVDAAIDRERAK